MKFAGKFVFLTLTLIHCITAVASECVQTFENNLSDSDRRKSSKATLPNVK